MDMGNWGSIVGYLEIFKRVQEFYFGHVLHLNCLGGGQIFKPAAQRGGWPYLEIIGTRSTDLSADGIENDKALSLEISSI